MEPKYVFGNSMLQFSVLNEECISNFVKGMIQAYLNQPQMEEIINQSCLHNQKIDVEISLSESSW